jgi:hypothetical protein
LCTLVSVGERMSEKGVMIVGSLGLFTLTGCENNFYLSWCLGDKMDLSDTRSEDPFYKIILINK